MPIKITSKELIPIMQPGVFILRGLPGSGKSTFAKDFLKAAENNRHPKCYTAIIHSADDYWINYKGEYVFDINEVPKNHHWCLRCFVRTIFQAVDGHFQEALLVDNTNTSIPEMETYIKIAQAYQLNVSIVTFNCSISKSISRNTHQVPEKIIKGMFEKLCYANEKLDKYCDKNKITNYEVD